jgi:hypothetical protein
VAVAPGDRVLRPGELPGTTRTSKPTVYRTLAHLQAWSPGVFGFQEEPRRLHAAGFRVAVWETLRLRRGLFDTVDSSAAELGSAAAAERDYQHERHYSPDPRYNRVRATPIKIPGIPRARAVTLALSSRTDATAHDRIYTVVFTTGRFL